jgi:hypothetical protein
VVKARLPSTRGEVEVAEATRRLVQILDVVSVSEPNLDRGASGLVRVCLQLRIHPGTASDRPRPARTGRGLVDQGPKQVGTATGRTDLSVRAGSVTAGEAADNHGQKRSPRDRRNRSSAFLLVPDLGRRTRAKWNSSLPTRLPRALRALAHEAADHRGRPHPPAELEPSPPGASFVVLAGRATRVPQAAVTSGT